MARVIHFEMPAADKTRARSFYESVFDWDIAGGGGGYWPATTGSGEQPGINGALIDESELHAAPVVIIGVESVEGSIAKARDAGAEVLLAKHTLPSVGYSAYVRDPEGNVVGLFESNPLAGHD